MPRLLKRLEDQLRAKGVKDPVGMAIALLKKRGDLSNSGKLTQHGKKRQSLGASGRAKDRAAKAGGRKASDFKYDKKTNRATLISSSTRRHISSKK